MKLCTFLNFNLQFKHTSVAVPLGVPHVASREGEIGGFKIPVDTVILGNLMEIHRDPENFKHPNTFKPDRFLDEQGKFVPPRDNFAPFSLG